MQSIDAVAFELWSISDGAAFDNVLITDSVDVANFVLDHTFQLKKEISDAETDHFFVKMIKETNKKPWLWIVYVLVIATPVILFIGYCCITPGQKKPPTTTTKDESTRKDESPKADEEEVLKDDSNEDQPISSSARLRKTKRAD